MQKFCHHKRWIAMDCCDGFSKPLANAMIGKSRSRHDPTSTLAISACVLGFGGWSLKIGGAAMPVFALARGNSCGVCQRRRKTTAH
jgi:hypothetical protein